MPRWKRDAAAVLCVLLGCGGGTGASTARNSGQPSGGPTSDAGSADPDAGNDAGGGFIPPVDAGADDAGQPDADAGTGERWDGGIVGSADGGLVEPPVCSSPAPDAPSDLCPRLNSTLGFPVVHQTREAPAEVPEQGVYCGAGAYPASGSGVVLHPMTALHPRFDFVDASGNDLGSFDNIAPWSGGFRVLPQAAGFSLFYIYVGGLSSYPIQFLDDHARNFGRSFGYDLVKLSGGGTGIISRVESAPGCTPPLDTRIRVQRFDEHGVPALAQPTELTCDFALMPVMLAANAAGDVLVLVAQESIDFTGWLGFWLDRDFRILQAFITPELAAARSNHDHAITTLLDGSFVLRFDGKWMYRIQPGATTLEPAPCWLVQRPFSDPQAIHDRTAYAVRRATSCDRALEILTPDGSSCGFVGPLESPGEGCEIAVGRDGTISGSAHAVDAGAGQPQDCVLKFWPRALGPSDP